MRICSVTQGTQTGALESRRVGCGGRCEGGLGVRGHDCTYGWFLLMFDKKHNSINYPSIEK